MQNAIDEFRANVSDAVVDALALPSHLADSRIAKERFSDFIAPARALAQGGKRTRALFVAAGWQLYTSEPALPATAGAAVELYQLSALVHDDIIDEAETRRGVPAAHRAFHTQHQELGLLGSAPDYGVKSGILLGDYLLSLGSGLIALSEAATADSRKRGIDLFNLMTAETAFGQFLDNRAEFTPLDEDSESAIDEALSVLLHKSARYSVEFPLLIGAALAGANDDDLAAVAKVGRPLGEAFQLRDDELGIFGDPRVTGKPAGGDLTEGKRTVLLALSRQALTGSDRARLDATFGENLDQSDVAAVRELIVSSGAHQQHEDMITERESRAREAVISLGRPSCILDGLLNRLAGRRH